MEWKIMTFITIFTINFNDDIMSELKLEVEKASGSKFAHKYDLNKSTINKLILEEVLEAVWWDHPKSFYEITYLFDEVTM